MWETFVDDLKKESPEGMEPGLSQGHKDYLYITKKENFSFWFDIYSYYYQINEDWYIALAMNEDITGTVMPEEFAKFANSLIRPLD